MSTTQCWLALLLAILAIEFDAVFARPALVEMAELLPGSIEQLKLQIPLETPVELVAIDGGGVRKVVATRKGRAQVESGGRLVPVEKDAELRLVRADAYAEGTLKSDRVRVLTSVYLETDEAAPRIAGTPNKIIANTQSSFARPGESEQGTDGTINDPRYRGNAAPTRFAVVNMHARLVAEVLSSIDRDNCFLPFVVVDPRELDQVDTPPRYGIEIVDIGRLKAGRSARREATLPDSIVESRLLWFAGVFSDGRLIQGSNASPSLSALLDACERGTLRHLVSRSITDARNGRAELFRSVPFNIPADERARVGCTDVEVELRIDAEGNTQLLCLVDIEDAALTERIRLGLSHWLFKPEIVDQTPVETTRRFKVAF